MSKHGKKYKKARETVSIGSIMTIDEALATVKNSAYASFDESVDIDVDLGIDPTKGDQVVRGSVFLPHERGRTPVVLVFTKGDYAEKALEAGADYVGLEDLIQKVNSGWFEFDYAIATPDVMGMVGKLAKLLGPRGLLPNKKLGTVTFDVTQIVSELKKGRVFFKNDKKGAIHFSFGKISFNVDSLSQNLRAFFKALLAAKPSASKGKYLKKATISSTMGIGIVINSEEA